MIKNITETIKYIGVDDTDIDLFESQYVVPNGISYNSRRHLPRLLRLLVLGKAD